MSSQISNELQTLLEMGFPQNRAERALHATYHKGAEQAMEWLFAHDADPGIDDPFVAPTGHTLGSEPMNQSDTTKQNPDVANADTENKGDNPTPQQAMSFKCDDCGKLLKDEADVQFHAAKTEHANYSESTDTIKPLSAEEKKVQMDRLQEKLKLRRLEREADDKKSDIMREKSRRATGKSDVAAKQKFDENEMKRMAEIRRREKIEDQNARAKIKAEIEKDKRDRAAKLGKTDPTPPTNVKPLATIQPVVQKEYTECRLQIRLTDGQPLTHSFPKDAPLQAVYDYVTESRPGIPLNFTLMTSFPKKLFSQEDRMKSLTQLGLVPSAVLIVSRAI